MHLADDFEQLEKDRERLRQQPRPSRTRFMAMDDAGGEVEYRRMEDEAKPSPAPRTGATGAKTHIPNPARACR
ncbi:hypothetical protein AWZ03_015485, partial [Drosophila navojoa]